MSTTSAGFALESASELDTQDIGERVARAVLPDGVLLLQGELGAGKTVLVKGVARVAGVMASEVQSPTFTLVHQYRGRHCTLTHIDLYRLEFEDVLELGLDELLAGSGLKAIEWPERLSERVPGAVTLHLRRTGPGRRRVLVTGLEPDSLPEAMSVSEEPE